MKKPNYTQISNEFIDTFQRQVSGAAAKVFNAVSRKTIGYHKDCEKISQGELRELTGLSLNSVKNAVKELEALELVKTWKKGAGKNTETYYELYFTDSMSKIDIGPNSNVSKIDTLDSDNVSEIDTLNGSNVSKIDTFFKEKENLKEINVKKDAHNEKSKTDIDEKKYLTIAGAIKCWNEAAAKTTSFVRYRLLPVNVREPSAINQILSAFTALEVVEAIRNYDEVIKSPQHDFLPYGGFEAFIQKGVEKFVSENRPLDRFRLGGPQKETPEERVKRLYQGDAS